MIQARLVKVNSIAMQIRHSIKAEVKDFNLHIISQTTQPIAKRFYSFARRMTADMTEPEYK